MNFRNLFKKLIIPFLDEKNYQQSNLDIKDDFSQHYLNHGFDEGRPAYFFNENHNSTLIPSLEVQYLRSNKLPNVSIMPEYFNGTPSPCSYIRLIFPLQYLEFLNELNFDDDPAFSKIWALNRTPYFINGLGDWLNSLRPRDRVLYDIDDDLITHYGKSSNEAKLIITIILLSDFVTVSTNSLQKLLKKFNKNTMIRKNFPLQALTSKSSDFKDDFSILFMGTSTHDKDLEFIYEALLDVAREYPAIKFSIVGIDALPNISLVDNISIASSYYPQFVERYKDIGTFKVGLIPLVKNSINLSKSNIKYYDYLNKCENILCSDVGEFSNLKLPRLHTVKNNKSQWVDAIKSMIEQPKITQEKISKSYNDAKLVKFKELAKFSKIINSVHFNNIYKFIDYEDVSDFLTEPEIYNAFLKRFMFGSGKVLDCFLNQRSLINLIEEAENSNYMLIDNLVFFECSLSDFVDSLIAQNKEFNLIINISNYDELNFQLNSLNIKTDSIRLSNEKFKSEESKNYLLSRVASAFSSTFYKDNLKYLKKIKTKKVQHSISSIKFQSFEAIFISF
jgi:hypothetical protein